MDKKEKSRAPVYQLKVTIKGIRPPIWRRIQVNGDVTLFKLHRVLQATMGWWDYHLHEFTIDGDYYGEPDPNDNRRVINDKRVRLFQVAFDEKAKFKYTYDFGDDWEHEIVVEKVLAPGPEKLRLICLAGKRRVPPEDCGGVWGYEHLLGVLRDPEDEEHEQMLTWAGEDFDPEAFDLERINRALREIRP